MKNLTNNLNIDFINHQILIEFTGGHYSEMMRVGTTHKVTVPYSCLSKKLQTIHRNGGKITNVSIPQLQLGMLATNSEELSEIVATPLPETVPETALETVPDQKFALVVEMAVEIAIETLVIEPIVEDVIEADNIIEPIVEPTIESSAESATTSPKSKKSKTSTKSGHGFNKPKDDTQPRSTRKPKS